MTMQPAPIPPIPEPRSMVGSDAEAPANVEPDVVDVLVADHREVEAIFAELEQPGGSPQRRRDLAHVVIAELVRHSGAEEQYVYPATRERLLDGDKVAEHEIAEHAQAEEVMHQLMKLDATDDTFDHLLTKLISDIRHHVREEEGELFPRLRDACDMQTLIDLGRKVLAAKRVGPTRPHPAAPNTPPLNKLAAPVMGAVDKAMDALTNRPTVPEDLAERTEAEDMEDTRRLAVPGAVPGATPSAEAGAAEAVPVAPVAETTTYRSSSAHDLPPAAEPVATEPADPDR